MTPSINCVNLVKQFEGCSLTAYPDPGTGAAPWTIGYGHTGGVNPGDVITQDQADAYLLGDLTKFSNSVVALLHVPVTQNQFDALVDFAYNVGPGNLANSTLLRKLNAGDYQGASEQFLVWNKAGGVVMPGLVRRRAAEQALFRS